jgi:hypothetical protein
MKIRLVLLTAAAIATVAAGTATAATITPTPGANADATFLTALNRTHHGTKAVMKVRYSCDKGDTLWFSAKQTKSGDRDPALKKEGSSAIAHTWIQSHRNPITCDGAAHTHRFRIDKVEPGSKGHLVKGQAWIQFCITFNEKKLILSKSRWVSVRNA